MSSVAQICYRFDLPDGSPKIFDFSFDAHDFRLTNPPPAALESPLDELKPLFEAWASTGPAVI